MTSVAVTAKIRNKQPTNFYVYYNKWTGEILSVGRTILLESVIPYIITQDEAAQKIIDGVANERNYMVELGADDRYHLILKDNTLRLRARNDMLVEIPRRVLQDWDIRVRLYTVNSIMTIEVNPKSINRLSNYKIRRGIKVEASGDFCMHVVKHNEPDYLIETIDIDPEELLLNQEITVDISHIVDNVSLDEIGILTLRHFENYYIEILADKYIRTSTNDAMYENDQIQRALRTVSDNCHIEITQANDNMIITSHVMSEQFDSIGLHQRMFRFYVVGDSLDEFIDYVDVDLDRLRAGYIERFQVDFDIEDVNIVYQNPKLITGIRKIK